MHDVCEVGGDRGVLPMHKRPAFIVYRVWRVGIYTCPKPFRGDGMYIPCLILMLEDCTIMYVDGNAYNYDLCK